MSKIIFNFSGIWRISVIWGLLVCLVLAVAYSNGANDNFKGVATLYGSKTTSYKSALIWATVTTIAGSLVSLMLAQALVKTFSGKGLIPEELLGTSELLLAVSIGTAVTIFIATFIGMPTSTTHALTGSLTGIALIATTSFAPLSSLSKNFLLPLILSPVIAVFVAVTVYFMLHKTRKLFGFTSQTCVCLQNGCKEVVQVQADGSMYIQGTTTTIMMDEVEECTQNYKGSMVGMKVQKPVDVLHYLSSGAVCFSRAVNDTPKIAALLLAAPLTMGTHTILGIVAFAMALGGWLNAKKVAETMSNKITNMSTGQGLAANLSTAALVLFASKLGVPVSTTHVSCGTLFGIASVNGNAQWTTIFQILFAWFTTFPFAAVVGALTFYLIS